MKTRVRSLLLLAFFLMNLVSAGQYAFVGYGKKTEPFFRTKTFAVLTGVEKVDLLIKFYFPTLWKVTPTGFMTQEEFKRNIGNKEYSFVTFVLVKVTKNAPSAIFNYDSADNRPIQTNFDDGYGAMVLIQGGKSSISKYKLPDFLAYCPLDHLGDENFLWRCYYRLPIMLYQLGNTVNLIREQKLTGSGNKLEKKLNTIYNSRKETLKRKVLLVVAQNIMPVSEEEFGQIYPYRYEFCTREKIAEVLQERDNRFLVYIPCNKTDAWQFIFDAETYDCVFARKVSKKRRFKIMKNDLKDMAEEIRKE